uniref:Lipocalin n=1 Tax=Rhipicephalus zambeziensis TaxID=60191 RepID=A0A224YCN5_9ACAR
MNVLLKICVVVFTATVVPQCRGASREKSENAAEVTTGENPFYEFWDKNTAALILRSTDSLTPCQWYKRVQHDKKGVTLLTGSYISTSRRWSWTDNKHWTFNNNGSMSWSYDGGTPVSYLRHCGSCYKKRTRKQQQTVKT